MNKAVIFTLGTLWASSGMMAQIKQDRVVSHFSSIKVNSAIDVVLTMGAKESLTFEAEESVISKLKAEVKNGTLVISCEGLCNTTKKMSAYVNAKELTGLSASDAARIKVIGVLHAARVEATVSDAGVIELNAETDELKAKISDASTFIVNGHAKTLTLNVEDASTYKGAGLVTEQADVTASDASTIKVNVSKSLKAKATDASTIIYTGGAGTVTSDAKDASTIKKG